MDMPGRHYPAKVLAPLSQGAYRYGFNGKERDWEDYGDGNQYDYGGRIYNPTIGRFLSVVCNPVMLTTVLLIVTTSFMHLSLRGFAIV